VVWPAALFDASDCLQLHALPKSLGKLCGLKHLEVEACECCSICVITGLSLCCYVCAGGCECFCKLHSLAQIQLAGQAVRLEAPGD
jgi:hypothetical protein